MRAVDSETMANDVTEVYDSSSIKVLEGLEAVRLRSVLDAHHWKRNEAAQALGISRATLWRRMRELHLA